VYDAVNGVQKGDHVSTTALTGAEVRRERNRREMQAAILDEASRIVAEDGLEALSLRAIARNLGYSPGALYEYFRDKDAILLGLYFKGADGLGNLLERTVASLPDDMDAVERLRVLAHAYRTHALANPELFRLGISTVMCQDDGPFDPADRASQGGYPVLMETVQRGQAEGVLKDLPAPVIVAAAWSLVHGFVALELTNHLAGGDFPGALAATPEEGLHRRNAAFAGALDAFLFGVSRR
jgi:AcrR family transcriptional regulator